MLRRLIALAVVMLIASQAPAGYMYTAVTKTLDPRGREVGGMTIKAMVSGPKARIEFVESGNPAAPSGGYLLTKDAGRLVYLVNPAEKTYMEWDIDKLANMAGELMNMAKGFMSMSFDDPKVKKAADEEGLKMLGYPTRHTRYESSYTMAMNIMGMRKKTVVETEEDIWTATALNDAGLEVWQRAMTFKTGDKTLDAVIAGHKDKIKGLPLKYITVNKTTDDSGRTQSTRTEMVVTELKKMGVAPRLFEIPADHSEKKIDLEGGDGEEDGGDGDAPPALKSLMKMFKSRQ